jgi:hypothetical protein
MVTTMNMKDHILAALEELFARWEALLAGLSVEQITAPQFDLDWSIKDVITHLWAWQQISIARIQAGARNREPDFPAWLAQVPGGWEEDANQTNAHIYATFHKQSWPDAYRAWRDGFLRLLGAAGPIPERNLLDGDKYPWLRGYSLAFILIASYEHHQEHYEKLRRLF